MQNPFAAVICEKMSNFINVKESLIKLSCDTSLKIKFEALSVPKYWIYIMKEHLEHLQPATVVLLHFKKTCLREKTFSAMVAIKSKHRYCFQLGSDLRIAVLTIHPRMPPNFKHAGPTTPLSKYS
jgi:hypothetical protein